MAQKCVRIWGGVLVGRNKNKQTNIVYGDVGQSRCYEDRTQS